MKLNVLHFKGTRPGSRLLITGGVHGDEFEPILALRRLAVELDSQSLAGEVVLIPIVNEPAFLRGTRVAEDGLDLARTCPGRPDGSITERIADAVSQEIRQADFYIDLHTGGTELCALPLSGYTMHPADDILDHQRRMARAFNLPIVWGTHPGLDGRTLSVARDAGVPAIYAEYLGAARCDPTGVEAYVQGCLNVMALLEILSRELPVCCVQRVVEDDRPHSGHMQICHRSPLTGFFETTVQLGQPVEQGQLLGSVTDLRGERVEQVRAEQSGLVLVLHTFCRVKEGTGLAVILETGEEEGEGRMKEEG